MALTKQVKERIRLNKLVRAQPLWRFGFDNEFRIQMGEMNVVAAYLLTEGKAYHYLDIKIIQERVHLFSVDDRKYLTKKQYEAIDRTKVFWLIRYFNGLLLSTLKTKEEVINAAVESYLAKYQQSE